MGTRLTEFPSHILHARMRWAFRRFPEFRQFVLGGDTVWLSRGVGESKAGWTRLGVHLYEAGAPPHVVDFDWYRASLERDVAPGDSATVRLHLPPFGRAGVYLLLVDLVVEGALWFADRGTRPGELRVTAV